VPDTTFLFVDSEMDVLLDKILSMEFALIPDLRYLTPEPLLCRDRPSVMRFAPAQYSWHLVRDDFSSTPLEWIHLDRGPDKGKYWIWPRDGGPMIDLDWSGAHTSKEEGFRFVRQGHVSYYATTRNTVTGEQERAPRAQRDAYKELAAFIRSVSVESVAHPPDQCVYRIGKEAARQWDQGLVRLGYDDNWGPPKEIPP
jgi:hypothetical protein